MQANYTLPHPQAKPSSSFLALVITLLRPQRRAVGRQRARANENGNSRFVTRYAYSQNQRLSRHLAAGNLAGNSESNFFKPLNMQRK
jgi:hypothetical protein